MFSIRMIIGSFFIVTLLFFMHGSYQTIAQNDALFLFSHGIADTHRQAYRYSFCYPLNDVATELYVDQEYRDSRYKYGQNQRFIMTSPFVTFDYPDATARFYRINIRRSGLAQTIDIDRLANVFYKTHEEYRKDMILMGVSRGASTIITFMGQKNPHNVSALILESPFDAMETVIEYKIKQARLHKIPGMKQLSHAIVSSIFFKYHMNGIRPIDLITHIDNKVPILLICSREDTLVPPTSTINLYKALHINNRPNVHILMVPHGKHARILSGPDGDIYQNVGHAFLQAYHLPHDKNKAEAGQLLFAKTQPAMEELIIV